jgi:leucyl/phenylalanyl-tRNA---protein transferase
MARKRPTSALDPEELLNAYANGAFPMADPGTGRISFYSCDPRCIIPLDDRFHVPKSLARVVRAGKFEVRFDTCFTEVMTECATDRNTDNRTWISKRMILAYTKLHELGFAHSVEAWLSSKDGSTLVGGLYGVAIGTAFFGESMFTRPDRGGRDASKVCLVHLIETLRTKGFTLLDSQYSNEHIVRFGAVEIGVEEYTKLLDEAVMTDQRW